MRLTKRFEDEDGYWYAIDNANAPIIGMVDKLGQLEDIEDDLGLDLGVFAKLLKYGGYTKTPFGIEKIKIIGNDIDFKGKIFYATTEALRTLRTLVFKDYGKTWALTKGELE